VRARRGARLAMRLGGSVEDKALRRACVRCEAPMGHRCVRVVAGTGERIPIKRIHPERKDEG
jgi:hypothetical protein